MDVTRGQMEVIVAKRLPEAHCVVNRVGQRQRASCRISWPTACAPFPEGNGRPPHVPFAFEVQGLAHWVGRVRIVRLSCADRVLLMSGSERVNACPPGFRT